MTEFTAVCSLCDQLAAESRRSVQTALVAEFLTSLESPKELESAVRLLLARPLRERDPRTLNVNFATVFEVLERLSGVSETEFRVEFDKSGDVGEAIQGILTKTRKLRQATLAQQPLSVHEVKQTIEALADATGHGAMSKRKRILEVLFSRATPLEAKYVAKNLLGEMRHGFSEGLMEAALAKAFNVSLPTVRHTHMTMGDLGSVARTLKEDRAGAINLIGIQIFNPYKPMLAQPVQNVREALKVHQGETNFEFKLDGARVQVHKKHNAVKIFSRRLTDITSSLPELLDLVREGALPQETIVEGEVIAVNSSGRPLPFQHVMRRITRVKGIRETVEQVPIRLVLFDMVQLGGRSLLSSPWTHRREQLERNLSGVELTPTLATSDAGEAESFFRRALSEGHEGLVAKKPNSPYEPGTRGRHWVKVKATETLDLTIVAAQYGTGYRHAWLSDYYLAARDPRTGEFHTVGKTFKGLTDIEIQEMTKRLLADAVGRKGRTVVVKPRVVVEVGFSEVQKSPNYASGYALRFARIIRVRDDKTPQESDSIERVAQIYRRVR